MGSLTKKTVFFLDNYLDFFDSRSDRSLFSQKSLNQIISMHGFYKLWGVPKKEMIESMATIDLMEPSRSTIGQGRIHGGGGGAGLITTKEATLDLKELKCHECPRCQVSSFVRLSKSRGMTMEREISKCSKNDNSAKMKTSVKGKKRESKDSGSASRKKKVSGICLDTSAIGMEMVLAGNVDLAV